MKNTRILSTILIILGIVLYILGSYISGEVSEGRQKIAGAQKGVDMGRRFSPSGPVGDIATGSVQKKIDEGSRTADKYQVLANWLHGSGIVFIVVGAGLLIFSFVRKKSS